MTINFSLRVSMDGIDFTIEKGIDFIMSQLASNEERSRPLRGPYLAQLEFIKQLKERQHSDISKLGMQHGDLFIS